MFSTSGKTARESSALLSHKWMFVCMCALFGLLSLHTGCMIQAYECRQNADCAGSQVCALGWCRSAGQQLCQRDGSCPLGMTCHAGICQGSSKPTGCTKETECKANEFCNAGVCQSRPSGCTGDADCKANERCQTGTCSPKPTGCTKDSECKANELCVSGACTPRSGCTGDTDCSAGEQCVQGTCKTRPTPACTQDSDCNTGEQCRQGSCVPTAACIPSNLDSQFSSTVSDKTSYLFVLGNGKEILDITGSLLRIRDLSSGQWRVWKQTSFALISRAVVSPNRRWLAISNNSSVELWDLTSGKRVRRHDLTIVGLHLGDDALLLIRQKEALWFAVSDGKEQRKLAFPSTLQTSIAAVHPKGEEAVFFDPSSGLSVLDLKTGKLLNTLPTPPQSFFFKFIYSPDGRYILGRWSGGVAFWDRQAGATTAPKTYPAHSLGHLYGWGAAFHPTQPKLLIPHSDGTALFINLTDGKEEPSFKLGRVGALIESFAFSPNGDDLIFSVPENLNNDTLAGDLYVYDLANKSVRTHLPSHFGAPQSAVLLPNDRLLSVTSDGLIQTFNASTGARESTQLLTFVERGYDRQLLSISPKGRHLVQFSWPLYVGDRPGHTVHLWDRVTLTRRKTLYDGKSYARLHAFSPNGRFLVFVAGDMTLRLWNLETLVESKLDSNALFPDPSRDVARHIAISDDGLWILASNGSGLTILWDVKNQKSRVFSARSKSMTSLAFSQDGKTVVFGLPYDTLYHKEIASQKTLWQDKLAHERIFGLTFSPQGHYVTGGSDRGQVLLWDSQTGKRLQTYIFDKSPTASTHYVGHLQFSPNGRSLIYHAYGQFYHWTCPF